MREHPPRFGLRNLLALGALAVWAWFAAAQGPDPGAPGRALGPLVTGLAAEALWFLPAGFLVPLVLPRMRGAFSTFFFVLIPSLPLAAAVTVLVLAAPEQNPFAVLDQFQAPGALDLLAPLAGMLAGVLLGTVLSRGLGAALLLIPALLGIGAVLLAIAAVALLVLTDRVASAEPVGAPTPAAADYDVALSGAGPADGGGSRIELDTEAFQSALRLAVAAAGLSPATRLALFAEGDALQVRFSLPWSVPLLGVRYMNLGGAARPSFTDGEFRVGMRSVSIGDLSAPPWVVRPASRVLSRWLRRGSSLAPFLEPSQWVGAGIVIADSSVVMRRSASLAAAVTRRAPVDDYLFRLERAADGIRERPDRIAGALEAVFGLAAERSAGSPAVPENRAALLVLGGAAGHPALLSLAGFPDAARTARDLDQRLALTLGGRRDWARHFLLSAGLTQVAPDGFPERAGADQGAGGCERGRLRFLVRGSPHGCRRPAVRRGRHRERVGGPPGPGRGPRRDRRGRSRSQLHRASRGAVGGAPRDRARWTRRGRIPGARGRNRGTARCAPALPAGGERRRGRQIP